jgi:hypothetical protein
MDMNEGKTEQGEGRGESLSGADGSGSDAGGRAGKGINWKAVLFVVVALVACGLAAHSMLRGNRCGSGGLVCGGKSLRSVCASDSGSKGAGKACPNSPGATGTGCCPGAGHRWGQK